MTSEEQMYCIDLLDKVKEIICKQFKPDGFNIGINVDEAGGQTVTHIYIHLIPRYKSDVEKPEGGVRGVIPSKKEY